MANQLSWTEYNKHVAAYRQFAGYTTHNTDTETSGKITLSDFMEYMVTFSLIHFLTSQKQKWNPVSEDEAMVLIKKYDSTGMGLLEEEDFVELAAGLAVSRSGNSPSNVNSINPTPVIISPDV